VVCRLQKAEILRLEIGHLFAVSGYYCVDLHEVGRNLDDVLRVDIRRGCGCAVEVLVAQ